MKTRFMRRMLAKGVILTSLTAPATACVVVIGDHPGDHDPRVAEFDSEGFHTDGFRDDGSKLASRVADYLRYERDFRKSRVKVYADNGKVTLAGNVDSTETHARMIESVRNLQGVEGVVARLAVNVD